LRQPAAYCKPDLDPDQIAKASSRNAATKRRPAGWSTASS
jgi:hypothetical protein